MHIPIKTKKTSRSLSDLFNELDGAFNLVGTEASCTDVHMAGGTVNDSLNTLHIGLPSTVGASVGVRDLNTKGNTLAANITFCQLLHLQSWKIHVHRTSVYIIAENIEKSKKKI